MTDPISVVITDNAYARRIEAACVENREYSGRDVPSIEELERRARVARANDLRCELRAALALLERADVLRCVASDALHECRAQLGAVAVEEATGVLARALKSSVQELRPRLGDAVALRGDDTAWRVRDGALELDQVLADHLAAIGPEGRKLAAAVREKAQQRWTSIDGPQLELRFGRDPIALQETRRSASIVTPETYLWWLWLNPTYEPTPFIGALTLAVALWRDRVHDALAEARFPTLPLGFQTALVRTSHGSTLSGTTILDTTGAPIGALEASTGAVVRAIPQALLGGIGLDGAASVAAHALFRWVPEQARERVLALRLDLSQATPVISIAGPRALCRAIGIDPTHTMRLRAALDWFTHARCVGADGTTYHGLLTWSEKGEGPGQPALIRIHPSDALLLRRGGRGKLTPVPHALPAFVGDPSGWAAQAALQLLVIEELRLRAVELVKAGGVGITYSRWLELLDAAGVARKRLGPLLAAWQAGAERRPAFLRALDRERWTLAEAYGRELEVLREGAAYTIAGKSGGRSKASRRLKRAEAAARLDDAGRSDGLYATVRVGRATVRVGPPNDARRSKT